MEYVKDRELFSNPYIIQMDRFAESLKHLSETFLYLEDYKGSFTKDEIEEMFRRVSERVCTNCEKRNWCLCENRIQTCQMVCEILCTAEEFGAELNVEIKRKLQKKCDRAPRFLRETLEVFGDAKQKLLWNNRIVQNREGCARSLISFADTISQAARELGAGIYSDERLEKKIVNQLKKVGIRVISSVFYMTKAGKCEVHLTLKAAKGHCVATREMAKIVSNCVGRSMYPEAREQPIIWEEYTTYYSAGSGKISYPAGSGKDRKRLRADLRGYISDDVSARRQGERDVIGWNGIRGRSISGERYGGRNGGGTAGGRIPGENGNSAFEYCTGYGTGGSVFLDGGHVCVRSL